MQVFIIHRPRLGLNETGCPSVKLLDIISTLGQGNHPLLCQSRFSEDEYGIIVDAMRVVRSDFAQSGRERCLGFVKEMHDYELVGQAVVAESVFISENVAR